MFRRRPALVAWAPEQIERMRTAGAVVGRTLALARDAAVAGVTTAQVDALAEAAIRDAGATPSFQGYHGFPASLCISVNEEVVHGIPGGRVLRDGDLVSIDCGAIWEGWHGDAALSLIVGGREAGTPEDLALLDDTEAALAAGIAALRVGERLFDVGAAVEASARGARDRRSADGLELDYGVLRDYVGHGIGDAMHLDPQVYNYAVREKGPLVPAGFTCAIEPMITLGGIETDTLGDDWTVVTRDGSRACHWEHTVLATGSGPEVLTTVPDRP